MYIVSIAIIEITFTFDDFKAYIGQRLDKVERLQQKLFFVPLGLGIPYWVQAPVFELNRHLFSTALPRSSGWHVLELLAVQEYSIQLCRERPLGEFIFVEETIVLRHLKALLPCLASYTMLGLMAKME
jgi:hypothetical protein